MLTINAKAAIANVITNDETWAFTHNTNDPGGCTIAGITQIAWSQIMQDTRAFDSVNCLTRDEIFDFYDRVYWSHLRIDELPLVLREPFFSCAINCGEVTAVKLLQDILGVVVDGHLGDVTIKASVDRGTVRYGALTNSFVDAWIKHYMDMVVANAKAWRDYANAQSAKKPAFFRADDLEGWFNRANKYRIY